MELNRYCIKVYAGQPINVLDSVPVFHQWIQKKRVPDHLLIDVADYSHVWQGPGIMLVSHEANFSLDQEGGRLGLLYQRKRAFPEGVDPLTASLKAVLGACVMLEEEKGLSVRFEGDRLDIQLNDRIVAPVSGESYAAVEKKLTAVLGRLYPGGKLKLTRSEDPRNRPRILVESGDKVAVKTLLGRLG